MDGQLRSAEELVKRALVEPGLLAKIQANPATELQNLAAQVVKEVPSAPPLQSDVWIYRMVVGALGLAALAAVGGTISLSIQKISPTPETLTALGSAAVGALAGLLAPSPTGRKAG